MKLSALATISALLVVSACDNGDDKKTSDTDTTAATEAASESATDSASEPTTGETDATEPTTSATDTGETTTAGGLSFATDVWEPIFSMKCAPCHTSGASGTLGMGMTPETAYAAIVDIKSSSSIDYVEPGDALQSYIFHKISGTQADVPMGSGGKMPQVGELSTDEITVIKTWINDGAAK